MKIITTGRGDIDRYFELSGVFDCRKLNHYPFIIFEVRDKKYYEQRIKRAKEELEKGVDQDIQKMLRKIIKRDTVNLKSGDTVQVKIVQSIHELIVYPDDTKVMAQWSGKWNSDFMKFTVKEAKKYYKKYLNAKGKNEKS